MANASRHKVGPGAQGKGSGTGAMSELPDGVLPDNMVLSNRDKSLHSDERGLDSKNVQTEQYQDHVGNRQTEADIPPNADGNTSGLANAKTDESGAQSSLEKQQNA